ncbi:MAG: hypothetical protein M0Z93_01025 [Actinomycetota bacterium]|nr:hypothetical protein [Actinomycetota bacterium]
MAMVVMVIALGMAASIVVAVTGQTTTQLASGRSTERAQVALSGLAQFVRSAVSPLRAWQAEGNAVGTYPTPAAPSPSTGQAWCWNETYPGPSPQSPLIGDQSSTNSTMAPAPYPSGDKLVDPSTLSVIYAHDYGLVLCSYPANGTVPAVPQVYDIFLDASTCTSSTTGDCTVDVVRLGSTSSAYSGATDYPVASSTYAALQVPPTAANASIVDQVPHVWCDKACQSGTSCWDYVATGMPAPAGPCSGVTKATEANYTPPLFAYLGGTTAAAVANNPTVPLDLVCGPSSGSPAVCSPDVTSTSSTDDTVNLIAAGIQSVSIHLSILDTGTTSSAGAQATASSPARTTVGQQVVLSNLIGQGGA